MPQIQVEYIFKMFRFITKKIEENVTFIISFKCAHYTILNQIGKMVEMHFLNFKISFRRFYLLSNNNNINQLTIDINNQYSTIWGFEINKIFFYYFSHHPYHQNKGIYVQRHQFPMIMYLKCYHFCRLFHVASEEEISSMLITSSHEGEQRIYCNS